jgi:hypothetical protein
LGVRANGPRALGKDSLQPFGAGGAFVRRLEVSDGGLAVVLGMCPDEVAPDERIVLLGAVIRQGTVGHLPPAGAVGVRREVDRVDAGALLEDARP